ncbi:ATP-binding protein [Candidatus Micrarchaeota archaeon]|nr:ATP-binding protein [Candidatus Micrarchaeota archaeon]
MIDLDRIYRIALENAALAKDYRKRFAYEKLKNILASSGKEKTKKQIILISGLRGIGKSTIMLQLFSSLEQAFYFSADSVLVKTEKLYHVVEQIYRQGYRTIFIDEIHKYHNYLEELKNIYDSFDAQIVASGSSTASIKKGSVALGRRAADIVLSPLTFGEFFYLREGTAYSAGINDAIDKKNAIKWLAGHPQADRYYREYLAVGGFPIKINEKAAIFKLIKKMIYEDALAEFNLSENKVDLAEKLLSFLSLSKLGEFSYNSFSSISGYAKSSVYEAVYMLKELDLLKIMEVDNPKSHAKATIKLLFSHPNLRAAFAEQLMKEADIGSLREEYFVFHMAALGIPLFIPKKMKKTPDYEVMLDNKKALFEIGGESKTKKQLMGKDGFVIGDEQLIVLGFVNNVQKTDQK